MNEKDKLTERVRSLLAEAFDVPVEEISTELAFGDLPQWDSLGHMEVMVRLEEQFGVEISAETIAELISVDAICSYLEARLHV
ncbi:MAG: acyl carrier protein [Chloroflexi bacterium]|jgi:acyl carrier protein|nr:acyl carrier protein [Chloroflexota bacterium]